MKQIRTMIAKIKTIGNEDTAANKIRKMERWLKLVIIIIKRYWKMKEKIDFQPTHRRIEN